MNRTFKYAFRLVHIDNVPHILTHGIVHSCSGLADPAYIPIGDRSLIGVRSIKNIPGTDKHIGDMIPFYFGSRPPMLYNIQHGYNVKRYPAEDFVYCVILLADIVTGQYCGYFTDGNARSGNTVFYPVSRLSEINELLCYEDVFRRDWGTNVDNTGELRRLKQAELLLENDLAYELVSGFIVYNDKAQDKMLSFGLPENKVIVRPDYYY